VDDHSVLEGVVSVEHILRMGFDHARATLLVFACTDASGERRNRGRPRRVVAGELRRERNRHYRCTWLRDAPLTIQVLIFHGLTHGATLRNRLLRTIAGDADDLKTM
jgi:hypothetical protein